MTFGSVFLARKFEMCWKKLINNLGRYLKSFNAVVVVLPTLYKQRRIKHKMDLYVGWGLIMKFGSRILFVFFGGKVG